MLRVCVCVCVCVCYLSHCVHSSSCVPVSFTHPLFRVHTGRACCSGIKYSIIYVCRFNELDKHQSRTSDPRRSDIPKDDHPNTHTTSPQITVTHQSHHHIIHPKNTRQSRPNTHPTLNPHQRRNTMKDPKILPSPQWSKALEAKMVSNYQSYDIN